MPHAIRSSRWARVHVTVGNPGNTPLTVGVAAQDREGRLEHTLRGAPPVVELPPGVAAVVPVVLRCTRLTWVGKAVPRDYTVTARSPAAEATSTGVLTQASVVPRWWILVVGVLVVLALASEGGGRVLAVLALLGLAVTLVVLVLRRLFAVVGRRTRP